MTIWFVKRGRAYEAGSDRCCAATGWCCRRAHATEHLTLESARHAVDGHVIEDRRTNGRRWVYKITKVER